MGGKLKGKAKGNRKDGGRTTQREVEGIGEHLLDQWG